MLTSFGSYTHVTTGVFLAESELQLMSNTLSWSDPASESLQGWDLHRVARCVTPSLYLLLEWSHSKLGSMGFHCSVQ